MLPIPFLPASVADRRPTALGVLTAVLLPPLVRAARAIGGPRPTPIPVRAGDPGRAPRCLR